MLFTHVVSLVDIRGGTTIKCAVVPVHLVILVAVSAVETSSISFETWILSLSCGDSEATSIALA